MESIQKLREICQGIVLVGPPGLEPGTNTL